jgi:two-component system sensor histidine kinase QseC
MNNSKSLRRRLTWYVVITMLIMSTLSGVGVYLGITHEIDEVFDASLVQSARVLDGLVSREIIDANKQELLDALSRSRKSSKNMEGHEYEKNIFFSLLDLDGEVLLQSRRSPELPADIDSGGFLRFDDGKHDWIAFALHSSRDDIIIVVGERTEVRNEVTEYIGSGFLYPLIVMLPAVVWMLWQLVGVALKPLQTVTDQVRAQDLRELKPIDVDGVPKEIDPLVNAMNSMIARLDSAYARERRFVSDASHELRNPLASLLINIENALEENSDPDTTESLQQMKTSIVRLSHLVSQLLELSHSENPLASREFTDVDLQQLCVDAVRGHQAQAGDAGVDLVCEASSQDCRIRGVHALLVSLLSNLVDNGIKYCGSGGQVVVGCMREGSRLTLSVEDSGAGLDAEARARVVERFYRAERADTSGAGLGLAIVKSIADIHAARMHIDESRLGGLAVRIEFDLG